MAPRDYKKLYEEAKDKQIADGFEDLKGDIQDMRNENKEQFTGLSKRVTKIESKVFPAQSETIKQLPPFWRDPQIIRLITYLVVFLIIVVVIVAGLWGFELPKGILS